MRIKLVDLQETDLHYVKEIYDYYTDHTTAVYFLAPVTTDDLKSFIPINNSQYRSYIIYTETGEKCGFCYFSKFKPREAYSISVEITIYLHPDFIGKGYGKEALNVLEKIIRKNGFKNIIALIDSENKGSIRLFKNADYTCSGHLKDIAVKFGKNLDVMFFQKIM